MLLGATDKHIRLINRFAGCFTDYRDADLVEHTVPGLLLPAGANRRVGLAPTGRRRLDTAHADSSSF
jgi:hypothetical protein